MPTSVFGSHPGRSVSRSSVRLDVGQADVELQSAGSAGSPCRGVSGYTPTQNAADARLRQLAEQVLAALEPVDVGVEQPKPLPCGVHRPSSLGRERRSRDRVDCAADVRAQNTPALGPAGGTVTVGETITLEDLERDPYPIYARLRDEEPVSWVPAVQLWLVTRFDDVRHGRPRPRDRSPARPTRRRSTARWA